MTDETAPVFPAEAWTVAGSTAYLPQIDVDAGADVAAELTRAFAPKTTLLISAPAVAEALIASGGTRGRHTYLMRHNLRNLAPEVDIPELSLRPWEPDDAQRLAAAYVRAYGVGHPDERDPDLTLAAESLAHIAADVDNPLMEVSQVAVVDGEPIGAAMVTLSEQVPDWSGPWLMNVFRTPENTTPGVGRAMILRTLHALADAGHDYYGLMVTTANPALKVYLSLGFTPGFEGTFVVLP